MLIKNEKDDWINVNNYLNISALSSYYKGKLKVKNKN